MLLLAFYYCIIDIATVRQVVLSFVSRKVLPKWFRLILAKFVDYAFKSYVLSQHKELIIKQKRASLYEYALSRYLDTGEIKYPLNSSNKDYSSMSYLKDYCSNLGLDKELKECFKINHAEYERTKRLKNRVGDMLRSGPCLFLTFTFTNTSLNETTSLTRRRAVTKFLKQYNCKFVANIDFGNDETKTMREHYHALINCDYVNSKSWKYGALNFERVRNKNIENDKIKLSKYISKLSNHAIKETTKRSSLIYSR